MSSPTDGLIFNNNQVSPQRLHVVVKLVVLAPEVSYEMLLKAIQPFTDNQAAARAVVAMARSIGLIQQVPDSDNHYSSKLPLADVENRENFRQLLVHLLLNPTDERDPQFLLSLCAAWYASQNGAILYE